MKHLKQLVMGWKNGPVVKSSDYSSGGPNFESQLPNVTPIPECLMPFSDFCEDKAHMRYRHTRSR